MNISVIFLDGAWWMDSHDAAQMLGIQPGSLRTNCTRTSELRSIRYRVWHRVRLWDVSDVLNLSRTRLHQVI
jgi:prophage antirepressor-like protein